MVNQNPAASIGLYVDCGSIYETPLSFGATHLLERMAFKSTTNRSHLRVVREVEAIGGNVTASASREQMGYTFDALKTYVPEMVELLVDCVRNPVFLDWEVNEQVNLLNSQIYHLYIKVKDVLLSFYKEPDGYFFLIYLFIFHLGHFLICFSFICILLLFLIYYGEKNLTVFSDMLKFPTVANWHLTYWTLD